MKIYKPDNTLLFDIPVNDSSFATDEIMNEDILMLEYELVNHLDVPVDSYCTFMGKTYYLMADSDIIKRSVRNHYYKLVMYTDTSKSKDVKYGFATVTRTSGQPPVFDVAKKIEFSLTGKPIDFAQLWVDNMNEAEGSNEWEVGECIDAPLQTIDFSDQTCFDVLGQVTTAFNTEWEITGKTLSLKPLEKSKDAPIPLSYGYDNGLLSGVSRVNYSDGKVINRLIMKGSDRNIVFETYGDTKLNLPKNYTIKFDGNYFSDEPEFVDSPAAIEYKTDANGSYVERSDRTGRVREDSLDCTTIYPMHEGTITSVDPTNNLIFFDSANTINYTDALIAGNTLQLIPQSGDLVGREFDVNYNHANKRFTLVRIEGNNDLSFPNANLKPKVGDKYAVFKIALPQQYIDDAELTALKACVRHLYNNEVPQYTYEGQLSELYAKQHWLEIGSKLQKGYFVNISDNEILPDGATIRIIKTEYYVNKPQQPKIYLSNKVTGKASTNRKNQIVNQEQTINRESQTQAERLRGTEYLRRALENSTTIDGGLILTSLIQLGYLDPSEVFVNTSGINGIYQNPNDVYAWAGGTLEQAINLVANPDAASDVANFVVTHGGNIIATEAYIKGKIVATSGKIGGFDISDTMLINTGFINDASIIFRNDIYKAFAGIGGNVLPASTGLRAVARFENNDTGDHWGLSRNISMMVQATGASENTAIYMSGGNVAGLALKVKQIDTNITATHEDVYFSCYNSITITIKLPTPTTIGKIYYIRLNNTAYVILDAYTIGGKKILKIDGGLENTVTSITRGELITLLWDGQYWLYSTTAQ